MASAASTDTVSKGNTDEMMSVAPADELLRGEKVLASWRSV